MATSDEREQTVSLRALDALNVFLADVRDGVGPYLASYLTAHRHWDPRWIGAAMSAMGIAQVAAQTPAGALLDATRRKRAIVVGGAVLVGLGCVAMVLVPTKAVVLSAQALTGAASTVFAPAIAAISLGLVGHRGLARRMGRNEAFNHAGNVAAAGLAGLIGYYVAFEGIFYLVAAMCLGSIVATLLIRGSDIDYARARGAAEGTEAGPGELRVAALGELLADRRIARFALAVVLFHFANAAMLPLAGQKVAAGQMARGGGAAHAEAVAAAAMSACIIAAQTVMVPVAVWSSRKAATWGRKPVFLVGFAVLPIRGLLYTLSADPYWLVAVQLLDGIGAGVFGVVGVLVIADLTRGTGRFNLMQGALSTATGIGASLSNLMAGFLVKAAGYDAGFLTLAAIAGVAFLWYWRAVPETGESAEGPQPAAVPAISGAA